MVPADPWWLNALWSLTPTIVFGFFVWLVIRSIFRSDRNERRAVARIEAEERERFAHERLRRTGSPSVTKEKK